MTETASLTVFSTSLWYYLFNIAKAEGVRLKLGALPSCNWPQKKPAKSKLRTPDDLDPQDEENSHRNEEIHTLDKSLEMLGPKKALSPSWMISAEKLPECELDNIPEARQELIVQNKKYTVPGAADAYP